MGSPRLGATWLTDRRPRLLVVGPSLGTSCAQLWQPVADRLPDDVGVLAWDLPGHGATPTGAGFDMAGLAAGVLALVDEHTSARGRFHYAGDSVGGAVGLQLLLDAPDRVETATLLSTGARIGERNAWLDRASTVRRDGTSAVADGSVQRWFSRATAVAHPDLVDRLSRTLVGVDAEGYAQVCEALADFDVRHLLQHITRPVLAVAGAEDVPTPPASLATIAADVVEGRLVVLDDVAHLPPVEAPAEVAQLLAARLGTATAIR